MGWVDNRMNGHLPAVIVSTQRGGAMLKPILLAVATLGISAPTFAQECLQGQNETAADRTRREQAVIYAHSLNAAEQSGFPAGGTYRRPEELITLPRIPAGFLLQFHTDGRTYAFSLKDGRDPCRFAIFSDQQGDLYVAVPHRPNAILTPLDTR
jgi:hypothetical protein